MIEAAVFLFLVLTGYFLFRLLLGNKARERRRVERARQQIRDANRAQAEDELYRQGW